MSYDEDLPGLFAIYWGIVADVADPERLGRVKIRVPGVVEPESAWAPVLAMPGASTLNRGFYAMPRVGAAVAVAFIQGDVDEPVCWCGPWGAPDGQPDAPNAAIEQAATDAPKVWAWQSETFEVVIRELPDRGIQTLTLRNRVSGDHIEMNARDGAAGTSSSITVQARTSLTLNCEGIIQIGSADPDERPAVIQINGRRVLGIGGPI